jgi:hypothetical protein
MEKISSIAGLKNAIQVLEVQQRIKGHELKEQISLTYESLKPVNLIRNTLKDFKAFGQVLFQNLFFKKEKNSKKDSGNKDNN